MAEPAARLSDPIGHSPTMNWLLAGVALGALAGLAIVATIGTGGLAGVAIVGGLMAGGGGIGEVLSTLSDVPKEVTGKIIGKGSSNVFTNSKPAARAHVDQVECTKDGPAPLPIASGSATVFINGMPAARVGDKSTCSAVITAGSSNVFIGGGTKETDVINPENLVPPVVHAALLVVGIGAAVVLAGPIVAVVGLGLGIAGGMAGQWAGGEIFGEGSDGQKLSALGGSILGGILGGKVGMASAAKLIPRATTPTAGFVKGGLPGMKTAGANQAADAKAAAQARADRISERTSKPREPVAAANKKDGKFTDLRERQGYDNEEHGAHFGGSKVKYLTAAEREQYRVIVKEGKLYDAEGKLFDTKAGKAVRGGAGKAIYVMDENGAIYASNVHSVGKFHHSSFLAGKPVAAAGEIMVRDGVVMYLDRQSGHYRPTLSQQKQFVNHLRDSGVDMLDVEIGSF